MSAIAIKRNDKLRETILKWLDSLCSVYKNSYVCICKDKEYKLNII